MLEEVHYLSHSDTCLQHTKNSTGNSLYEKSRSKWQCLKNYKKSEQKNYKCAQQNICIDTPSSLQLFQSLSKCMFGKDNFLS